MSQQFLKAVLVLLLPLCAVPLMAVAQGNHQQPVTTEASAGRVYTTISSDLLQQSLDSLFARIDVALSATASMSWGDVLVNGSNPGMDIDFSGYDISGLGDLTSTGSLSADSLSVTDVIDGQIGDLSNHDTGHLTEGSNLYFTAARAIAALSDTLAHLLGRIEALESQLSGAETFTCGTSVVNYDGHDYATVKIGTQCWFAENLRTTKYNDEAVIPGVLDASAWSTNTDGAITINDEGGANESTNLATYGRLYNWHAVNTGKLCPSDWHVPTDEEWTTLTDYLGGESVAGAKMKSSASDTPAWDGSNSSGFSGLPGGFRASNGLFFFAGSNGYWWSSSPNGSYAWFRSLNSNNDDVNGHYDISLHRGFSVRCVRDAASSAAVPTVVTSAASDVAETGATLIGSISDDGGDAITATGFRWGQVANLSDAQDLAGSATSGPFTGSLTGLATGTTYYFTAFATNGEGTSHGDTLSFTTTAAVSPGFVTCGDDITFQGYDYATVEIGNQCWFAENLRSTKYNDETDIPSGLEVAAWSATSGGAMTIYDEGGANEATNLEIYGRLYNWHAVNTGKLCPSGWHVPTDEEWTTLTDSLGGESFAGVEMKSSASDNPAWDGSNGSGFSGLPGGVRWDFGNFHDAGSAGYWWSSSPYNDFAWNRYLFSNNDNAYRSISYQRFGCSVRCVSAAEPTVVTSAASDVAATGATLNGSISDEGWDAITATGFRWGQAANLSDAQDLAGSATSGSFTGSLTGLAASTTYYFTAFATNGGGTTHGDTMSFTTTAAVSPGLVTCGDDMTYQGYDYATVEIGTQCWFAENLRSTEYNDDAVIPSGLDNAVWSTTTDGAMTIYDEGGANEATNLETYGRLYNWHAVNTGKLCPSGWHVPTDGEWTTLTDHLGTNPGAQMKSSASDTPEWNGSNSSGFSGLPGGYRSNGGFGDAGSLGFWWSSSPAGSNAWNRDLNSDLASVHRTTNYKGFGFSVRCVSAAEPTVVTAAASDVAETGATLNASISDDGGDAITATGFRWGQAANLSDAQDLAGSATSGSFTGSLTGLATGTTYYFTAFATNGEGTSHGDTLNFTTWAAEGEGFVTCGDDMTYQGYDYATVEIGTQCWFAENLQSGLYADGSAIPNITDNEWVGLNTGAKCAYDNDDSSIGTYGVLYNGYAVGDSRGLCPSGWHVPTDDEWFELTDYLGDSYFGGDKMKSSASDSPSWNGTNSSGFSGLPGGYRNSNGSFENAGNDGYWWSSSPNYSNSSAWYRVVYSYNDGVYRGIFDQRAGLSIRCVRD